MLQLHYEGPRSGEPFKAYVNDSAADSPFAVVDLGTRTFMYIDEDDAARLADVFASARDQLAQVRKDKLARHG